MGGALHPVPTRGPCVQVAWGFQRQAVGRAWGLAWRVARAGGGAASWGLCPLELPADCRPAPPCAAGAAAQCPCEGMWHSGGGLASRDPGECLHLIFVVSVGVPRAPGAGLSEVWLRSERVS